MGEDLSDTFGAPAASVLRGLLPPWPAAIGQQPVSGAAEQRKATGSAGDPVDEADSDATSPRTTPRRCARSRRPDPPSPAVPQACRHRRRGHHRRRSHHCRRR